VIVITKKSKFVFVKQCWNGLSIRSYELCAGVCNKEDASYLELAQLLEEIGYENSEWSKLMAPPANSGIHINLTHCYLAIGVEKLSAQRLDRY
jgi:ADP-ribose pyrophosphatase